MDRLPFWQHYHGAGTGPQFGRAAARTRHGRIRGGCAHKTHLSRLQIPKLPAFLHRPEHLAHRYLDAADEPLSWLIYRLTGSALLLGLLGFAGQIPSFIIAPFAGVAIDRWDRYRILLVTQSLAMLQASVLAFLVLTGTVDRPVYPFPEPLSRDRQFLSTCPRANPWSYGWWKTEHSSGTPSPSILRWCTSRA